MDQREEVMIWGRQERWWEREGEKVEGMGQEEDKGTLKRVEGRGKEKRRR